MLVQIVVLYTPVPTCVIAAADERGAQLACRRFTRYSRALSGSERLGVAAQGVEKRRGSVFLGGGQLILRCAEGKIEIRDKKMTNAMAVAMYFRYEDDEDERRREIAEERRVPVYVKGRVCGDMTVRVVRPVDCYIPILAWKDAMGAIARCTAYLNLTSRLIPHQTVGYPTVRWTHVNYEICDGDELAPRREMLAEIAVGRQRLSEKRHLTRVGRRLPEEIVDLLHDFVWPVDRRRKA